MLIYPLTTLYMYTMYLDSIYPKVPSITYPVLWNISKGCFVVCVYQNDQNNHDSPHWF